MMSKKVEDRFENPSLLAKALEPFTLGTVEQRIANPCAEGPGHGRGRERVSHGGGFRPRVAIRRLGP